MVNKYTNYKLYQCILGQSKMRIAWLYIVCVQYVHNDFAFKERVEPNFEIIEMYRSN